MDINFNSHTREGVTIHFHGFTNDVLNFNSHTREGVTVVDMFLIHNLAFQHTHP